MLETITLIDGTKFKVPDGYFIDLINTNVYNEDTGETISIPLISINKDDDDTPEEYVKE